MQIDVISSTEILEDTMTGLNLMGYVRKFLMQATDLPADGVVRTLPNGREAVHYPGTKLRRAYVLVRNGNKPDTAWRAIRTVRGWSRTDQTTWVSAEVADVGVQAD